MADEPGARKPRPAYPEDEAIGLFGERSGIPAGTVNRANAGCAVGCLLIVVGLALTVGAALVDPALGVIVLVALAGLGVWVWRRL